MKFISIISLAFLFALSAMAADDPTWKSPGTPDSPATFWKTPTGEAPKLDLHNPPTPESAQNKTNWSLAELIDLALQISNTTRETWNDTKARMNEYRSKKGYYFPEIGVGAALSNSTGAAVGGRFTFKQNGFSPTATLNWVLYDFGK